MYKIIDGKKISAEIKEELADEVKKMQASGLKQPHLAAILVGNDGASETYVNHKIKACEQVGFKSTIVRFPDTVSEQELIDKIKGFKDFNDTGLNNINLDDCELYGKKVSNLRWSNRS